MRRRDFITLLGSAAVAWPLATRAEQPPLVGFLRSTRAEESGHLVAAVREGLRDSGYSSDKVRIESRWGDGREEELPKLARELVALPVAAIIATSTNSAVAAKAATGNIPIVFVTGRDPQTERLVSSISRPGGNMTGVSFSDVAVSGKRLALLHELVPNADVIAVLLDPTSSFKAEMHEIEMAARAIGQKIITLKAGNEQEIRAAFSTAAKSGAGALFVGGSSFFNSHRSQLIGLAALHAIPASYPRFSATVAAGGLVSYGASETDAYRRAGAYVARILNGEKPGDLPVELPTKFELAINLKTAKTLGLTVPPALIARADEVIQ